VAYVLQDISQHKRYAEQCYVVWIIFNALFCSVIIKVSQLAGIVKSFIVTDCAGTANTQRKLLCV
jgi:hypothetical protein